MRKTTPLLLQLLLILTITLSGCTTPAPAPAASPTAPSAATAAPGEQPIYLSIIWHQHQPVYYKDPATGVYAKPWVRVHAAKDYVDMAAILEQYPGIHATFNLTPSLITQLDDLQAGAKDLYWITTEVPADALSDEQKEFLLARFFDTNAKIIARFPRYGELQQMRETPDAWTAQDFLDLQVLFNLAWTDPDWLAQEPLKALVEKGRDFSEEDKATLLAEHARLIAETVPLHKRLQDAGQIEVTMTPFAHPILPLLVSTGLAEVAMPGVTLPAAAFTYGQDAVTQVQLGVQLYEDHFGRPPRGMWPAEGSVAEEIVTMVANAGIQWMASDEGVLANSLGRPSFTRNMSEVVTEPDVLYRPYYVQAQGDPVAMVFRDVNISDKVGFTYSGVSGTAAAQDFIRRIHNIRDALIESGAPGPHLVSVILDGENAWEHYENDGKEFLHALYQGLSDDPLIKTVTPSEFLALAPEQPAIADLWAGSWISHDFSTWIGEDEENRAWEALTAARVVLQKYENGTRQPPSPEALEQARSLMYIAQGSDWFWWFGSDQNSGDDGSFDQQFRATLQDVYTALGETPPRELDVPIIPQQAVAADVASTALIAPQIDGQAAPGEWDGAGVYTASGGAMASAQPFFAALSYGFDAQNLFLKIELVEGALSGSGAVEVYLSAPGQGETVQFSRAGSLLGFPANRMLRLSFESGALGAAALLAPSAAGDWQGAETALDTAAGPDLIEVAVPIAQLGALETGDRLNLRAVAALEGQVGGQAADSALLPAGGPALVAVPDLGTMTVLVDVADPAGDDHGPGGYTYPSDAVFPSGVFDALNFQVGEDAGNIVFKFTLDGPLDNSWGSPNGLSVQTFDIYIDRDGDDQGGDALLPGRNLALQEGFAWDLAVTVEGWESGVYTPGDGGPERIAAASQLNILADPGQNKLTVRVPKDLLGDNPQEWRFAAMVLGQEGYPSGGVMRVRDVFAAAEQWKFGGAPAGSANHTRVIDLIWAAPGEQESWLSGFTPALTPQGEQTAADYAAIPMLEVAP